MSKVRVTVIIPAYQSAGTIARPLASLMSQTRPADEILVIDDGSTDDLASAIAPFISRIILIRKPNGGAASARNLGIEHSKGELIAFLDADDYWEPTKLERQLAILKEHPEVGLVGCRWFEEPPGGARTITQSHDLRFYGRALTSSGEEAFEVAMCLWTSALLIRRNIIGDQRFVSGLEPAEDRDLWIRLVEDIPVYLIADPLATYVLVPGSLSRSNVDRDCKNMLRVIHRHSKVLGTRATRTQEVLLYRRWAAEYLGRGNAVAAIAPAWHRMRRELFSLEGWWILCKSGGLALVGRPLRLGLNLAAPNSHRSPRNGTGPHS